MTRAKNDQGRPGRREGSKSARDPQLSADLQAHIGVRLKAFYDSVLSEPIPDRFAELLDRLDTTIASAADPASSDGAAARPASDGASTEAAPSDAAGTKVRP